MSRARSSATASPAVEVGTAARTLAPGALAAAIGLRQRDDAETCRTCGTNTLLLRSAEVHNLDRGPGRVYHDAQGHIWIVRASGTPREELGRYKPRWDATGNRPDAGPALPVPRVS